ncbi:hypothetical protein SDC9_04259 [bioreactor metagenome]|uniref:Uncharacterized protein n=1 Tax=bioreactor metagenome TaxID=1076179 RepID=A0A644SWT9_9ZZZZ
MIKLRDGRAVTINPGNFILEIIGVWLKGRLKKVQILLLFYKIAGIIVTSCTTTNILQLNTFEVGALTGLIGKSGVTPARSRHCNEEQTHVMPLGRNSWEGLGER